MHTVRRSRPLAFLALLMIALCCGLALGGLLILGSLPGEAAAALGPASPSLPGYERVLLGGYLLARANALDRPAGANDAALDFEVTEGENAGQVVERLRDLGVVSDPLLLRAYLRYRGMDVGIEAGQYRLSGQLTVRQLAETLQTARTPAVRLTVIEGWRLEQIASALRASHLGLREQEFLDLAHTRPPGYSFSDLLPEPPTLEGFLFPDTYHLTLDATAEQVLHAMLDNFERRADAELREGFARQGLGLYQAVTLASIVEREAVVPDERPLIASVFLNRLAAGMNLDADPTVQYALGLQPDGSWWKSPLTAADLELDSPYNTYRHPGLPPTPIASPGLSSLRAVAFPAQTAYFYFRALCDGSGRHAFATTFEEHLQNACP